MPSFKLFIWVVPSIGGVWYILQNIYVLYCATINYHSAWDTTSITMQSPCLMVNLPC